MTTLDACLCCKRYDTIECLVYSRIISDCEGGAALLNVTLNLIRFWDALGICRLLRNMAVGLMIAFFFTGRLTEIDWKAMENQELFPYNYEDCIFMVLSAERLAMRCSACGTEARKGGRSEVKLRF